jgi:hypothetical protein
MMFTEKLRETDKAPAASRAHSCLGYNHTAEYKYTAYRYISLSVSEDMNGIRQYIQMKDS